jgi:hypothetical protein
MSTGKPMSRREEWLEFWERREAPFLRLLPYVLLLLCTGFDVATRHGVGSAMRIDLALVAGAAVVMTAVDRAAAVAEGFNRGLLIPRIAR